MMCRAISYVAHPISPQFFTRFGTSTERRRRGNPKLVPFDRPKRIAPHGRNAQHPTDHRDCQPRMPTLSTRGAFSEISSMYWPHKYVTTPLCSKQQVLRAQRQTLNGIVCGGGEGATPPLQPLQGNPAAATVCTLFSPSR